jgi:hypothetical protein
MVSSRFTVPDRPRTRWLLYEDATQSPADITYHVIAGLVHGQLELASAPGIAITSFTQADIDVADVLGENRRHSIQH